VFATLRLRSWVDDANLLEEVCSEVVCGKWYIYVHEDRLRRTHHPDNNPSSHSTLATTSNRYTLYTTQQPNHQDFLTNDTMHYSVLLTLATAATGALAGPLKRDTAETTTYACNPAHSYPGGAHCVSTNGALSLVTPTASSSSKACKATSKAPTTAAAATTKAASSTAAASSKAATTAAAATSKASSSSAKACSKKPTTTAAASSSAEASKSSAAQSAASAVSTKDATGGQTKIDGLTWTVQDFTRYCSEDKTGCDYNFKLTSSDHKLETACTIIRTNVKDAPTENWTNIPCTTGSDVKVSWGYSAQFGADHAFATLVVVDDKEIGYFGVADVNSKPVTTTPSNPFGSGQFGNLGPNPVYHV
jgi:hypothetical protein